MRPRDLWHRISGFAHLQEATETGNRRIRALPFARGHQRPTLRGPARFITPKRPQAHPALTEARERAARLREPREARLQRGRLHRHHHHAPQDLMTALLARRYAEGKIRTFEIDPPTPWGRYALQIAIRATRPKIPEHKWGHHARLNDIADHYALDRR